MNKGMKSKLSREEEINKMVARNRQKCNRMTDADRERLLERGMQIIYGGGEKPRVSNSHRRWY